MLDNQHQTANVWNKYLLNIHLRKTRALQAAQKAFVRYQFAPDEGLTQDNVKMHERGLLPSSLIMISTKYSYPIIVSFSLQHPSARAESRSNGRVNT